jgi:hypothetical protein
VKRNEHATNVEIEPDSPHGKIPFLVFEVVIRQCAGCPMAAGK